MQKEYFNMKEEASPSPSEGGDVFPQTLLSFEKKPHHQPNYSLSPNPSPNGITPPNLPQGEEHLTGTGEKKALHQPNNSLSPSPNQRSLTEGK